MLKSIFYPSQFLVYKRTKLGLFIEGSLRGALRGKGEDPFGWKHPKENLSWGDRFLALKKKKKEI